MQGATAEPSENVGPEKAVGSTRSRKREVCISTYSFCCRSRSRDNPNEMEVRYTENGTEDQYAYDRRRGDRVGVTLALSGSVPDLLTWVLDRKSEFIAIHEESKENIMQRD
jgi:hypothetical protein